MMRKERDLVGWIVGLLIALGVAYVASLPRTLAEGQISIVTLDQAKIASIMMKGPDFSVTAKQQSPGRWWLSYERSSHHRDQIPSSLDASGTESFLASSRFKDFTAALTPVKAVRRVGVLSDKQKADFGLNDDARSLEVLDVKGEKILALGVGKALYGSRNVYVLNREDQNVYLVSGDWLSDFEKPELRFYERNLTSIPSDEWQAATLLYGGKQRRFNHVRRDSGGNLLWIPESGDEASGVSAGAWFSKFEQLKAATYATPTQENELAARSILFEVQLNGLGASSERIQIRKLQGSGQFEYWATSSFLGGHVKVARSRAEVLEQDLGRLVAP
jgi:hypothetical protein